MGNKIFVTGGSGRLGKAVLARIPQAIALVRKPSGLPKEVLTDFSNDQLRGVLKDAKALIHLAGIIHGDARTMRESNVGLTWRLINALPADAKAVYSSTIAVYGKRPAQLPASETTKAKPDSDYARSKFEAEKIVARHGDHCILRIGTIYGPEFEDYYAILRKIQEGRMKVIGSGKNRIPFVHAEDVAECIANALERGKGLYVVAGDPLSQERIYEIASRELGVQKPGKHVNAILAKGAAFVSEAFGKASARESVAVLSSDRVFECSKAKKELGFSPRPLEQGIREMVESYKKRSAKS